MKLPSSVASLGTESFTRSFRIRHTGFFAAIATSIASVLVADDALAADYYWRGSGSDTWNNLTKWTRTPTGGGNPSAFLPTDAFIVGSTGGVLNTSYTSGSTFGGGTLQLNSGGTINVRVSGASNAVVNNFVSTGGGRITAAFYDTRTALVATAFENRAGVLSLDTGSGSSLARNLTLEIGTLSGAGSFTLTETSNPLRTLFISVTDATAYTGAFDFARGTINFNNDLVSGGALILSGGAVVTLDQNVTFASVTINGTPLAAGFHSFDSLNRAFDAFFTDAGSGGITVSAAIPEPSTVDERTRGSEKAPPL